MGFGHPVGEEPRERGPEAVSGVEGGDLGAVGVARYVATEECNSLRGEKSIMKGRCLSLVSGARTFSHRPPSHQTSSHGLFHTRPLSHKDILTHTDTFTPDILS